MDHNYLKKGGLLKPKIWQKKVMNFVFIMAFSVLPIAATYAQNVTVSGKVTDSTGEGLPGVNVLVKGTLNGGVTDVDGNYQVSAPEGATLVFTYIGFATQEVAINSQGNIDISMAEDYGELDEVVVIGYGTTKKSDLTGSVTAINAKDFNKGQINTPQDLLTGRIAGVSVISNDGAPGGGATIRIRGGSSLSASNDPLFVVDGVPLSTEDIGGIRNPLSTINPQDIETVTVLKDASATAIYGARASNGVILITTKRGAKGAGISVNYNAQFSISKLPNRIDMLSSQEFTSLVTQAVADGTLSSDAAAELGSADTDWQNEVFQDAFGTNHNISASGDFKGVPFRVSAGYLNQEGTLKTTSFDRTSVSIGLDPTLLNDDLKVSVNFKGSINNNQFTNDGAIGAAFEFDPTQPVRTSDSPWGGYFFYPSASDPTIEDNNAPSNPVALLEQTNNDSRVSRMIANIHLNYSLPFIEGLSANLNLATDRTKTDGLEVVDSLAASERRVQDIDGVSTVLYGRLNKYDNDYKNDLIEFYLNYRKELPALESTIEVIGGYSYQHFKTEEASEQTDIQRLFEINPFDVNSFENRLISFYGRMQYNLKEKYLLTFTLRRDGSSRFIGDNQWGLFPSGAFAWRVKDEDFLKNIEVLSDLKFRAGYGVTAQENVGESYPALARINISQDNARYQFGNDANGNPVFLNLARFEAFDPNLKWEETTTINFGLDYGFWNGRISGSFDWYKRETDDLLSTIPIPIGTNFSNELLTNVGSLENTGVEFSINAIVVDNSDWRVDLGYNVTANKNEITKLTATDDPEFLGNLLGGIDGGTGNTVQINSVGENRNTFFLYEQVYDQNGNPLEGVFVDQNDDGIINNEDRVKDKNSDPNIYMGFSSNIGYKNISLGFNARMQLDNYVYNNVASNFGHTSGAFANGTTRNRAASVNQTNFANPQLLSNYYLEAADFFRMDNITLSYFMNEFLSEKFSANFSFTVQNAFVISDYSGLDPEVQDGLDKNIYPRPRVFTLGINVNFK